MMCVSRLYSDIPGAPHQAHREAAASTTMTIHDPARISQAAAQQVTAGLFVPHSWLIRAMQQ